MKEELIQLAQEKGFTYKCPQVGDLINPYDFYVWMCKLQKWLRDNHNIDCQPICSYKKEDGRKYNLGIVYINENREVDTMLLKVPSLIDRFELLERFDSYEKALEKGLPEALRLIKTESKDEARDNLGDGEQG